MWLTFGLTILIVASWLTKMIATGEFKLQKTPLDIPIFLFVLSQIVSTYVSWDMHTSLWGYYSRFNGGLLSILSYVFLYYGLLSNYLDLNRLQTNKLGYLINSPKATYKAYALVFLTVPLGLFLSTSFGQPAMILGILVAFYLTTCYVHGELTKRLLTLGLTSGALVALWGLPSHFGYDPTCLLFRGTLDVSCWTESFQPKLRIFSTFGQPNWLAAYLAILLPIAIGLILPMYQRVKKYQTYQKLSEFPLIPMILFILVLYIDLLFTGSQSGYVALIVSLIVFIALVSFPSLRGASTTKQSLSNSLLHSVRNDEKTKSLSILVILFLLLAFILGQPIHALDKFTLPSMLKTTGNSHLAASDQQQAASPGELGGTDSGTIRKIVWAGALDIWRHYPLFGTGVETYAYSYYKFRPVAHNMTSEWDFLYNKAHNEYLNFLATTGIFGLSSYLLMIGAFLWISLKKITNNNPGQGGQITNKSQAESSSIEKHLGLGTWDLRFVTIGLLAGYVSILISNFFGFSVVVINIYFYLIPAIVLLMLGKIPLDSSYAWHVHTNKKMNILGWISLTMVTLISAYFLLSLVRFWVADTHYAKGYNLDRAGEYQMAYPELRSAVLSRYSEPTFQDEYSFNVAVLAVGLNDDKQSTSSALLAQEAERISDYVVSSHPNNVVFWKTRVRMFYALSQIDKKYVQKALEAIQKAAELAPTDAKVMYNLGVLYGQNGQVVKAIDTLEETVTIKPDYVDARYGLGLYYREAAVDTKGRVTDEKINQKAIDTLMFVVNHFPKDQAQKSKEALQSWDALEK